MSQQNRSVKSASSRVRSAIDRAGAIQQREQLREMLITKFTKEYAPTNGRLQDLIRQIVDDYFKNEKISEQSLKMLKQRVQENIMKKKNQSQSEAKSQISRNQNVEEIEQAQLQSQNEQRHQQQFHDVNDKQSIAGSIRSKKEDDQESVTSSQKYGPRSVYVVDEEDEWSALVKFDTELFKKEQELELQRQQEYKRKIKAELDKQLDEKRRKKLEEEKEEQAYVRLQEYQMKVYDQREDQKKKDLIMKAYQEKKQRDKQVKDEERRKRLEKRKEKELDDILVRRIQEEISMEQKEQFDRKMKEKDRLIQMMEENEVNRRKIEDEQNREKMIEIDLQEKYSTLLKKMEDERELEKREREDKIKRIMSSYAQTVVKDQKEMIKEEDNKMFRAIQQQNEQESKDEERRFLHMKKNKQEMRKFLQQQMEEKKLRQKEEQDLNKKQAQVWEEDLHNYQYHESSKNNYIKDVNLRHQEILKQQMDEKRSKLKTRQSKMTKAELMQNKPILKEMAQTQDRIRINKVNIGE